MKLKLQLPNWMPLQRMWAMKICDRNTPDLRQQPERKNGHLRFASISIALASQRTQELCAVLSHYV